MEHVAEGCWSMLKDVKSTPPTLTLPGYFFPAGLKRRTSRIGGMNRPLSTKDRGLMLEMCVNVKCLFTWKNEQLFPERGRTAKLSDL